MTWAVREKCSAGVSTRLGIRMGVTGVGAFPANLARSEDFKEAVADGAGGAAETAFAAEMRRVGNVMTTPSKACVTDAQDARVSSMEKAPIQ